MDATRKIVNKQIEKLRKEHLKLTQPEFAKKLGMEEKKGRSTINNWESGSVQVKSDDLILISEKTGVSTDWLLGRETKPSLIEDIQAAADLTGLSVEAISYLHYLKEGGDQAGKQTISFINRVLSHPEKSFGSSVVDGTLFSWMEEYVTSDSAKIFSPEDGDKHTIPIRQSSGFVEYLKVGDLYKELLISRIRERLNVLREGK